MNKETKTENERDAERYLTAEGLALVRELGDQDSLLGKDAKSVVLQSRVQAEEKKVYQQAAKAEGKDLSTWVRETLNRAIKA